MVETTVADHLEGTDRSASNTNQSREVFEWRCTPSVVASALFFTVLRLPRITLIVC